MQKFKKLIALVLTLAMSLSLFVFPFSAYSAEEEKELVIYEAKRKTDVTKIFPKLTPDSKNIKNSKFSAKWVFDTVQKITLPAPKDLTPYNEFVATVYATDTGTFYVYFETDNKETEGIDSYGRSIKLVKGWQDISIPFAEITDARRAPSWGNITNCAIQCNDWSQKAQKEGMTVYIDYIALVYNPYYDKITADVPKNSTGNSGPTPTPEALADKVGYARYYENDFEDGKSTSTKPQISNVTDESGNHYILAKKDDTNSINVDFSTTDVTRYVIYSLDVASTLVPSSAAYIGLRKSSGDTIHILDFNPDGTLSASGLNVGKLNTKTGAFTHLDFAVDFGSKTYAVYVDGKLCADNVKFSKDPYSSSIVLRIWIGAIKHNGSNLMVDNVKIFDGKTPDNYPNTLPADSIREKKFDELVGYKSPYLQYGDKAVKVVDNANGVAMNVKSGYIYANGKKSMPDAPAYIKNGRTLLPVRAVSEALGCEVGWDDATKTVTINGNAKIVIGSTNMILPNGSSYTLDVPAEITNGRTFIPLRALCEQILGKKVFWDDRGLIVLSDNELSISDENVALLNNFMLYVRPEAEELLASLQANYAGVHPRAIYDRQGFDNMVWRYNSNEIVRRWGDDMIEIANGLLGTEHVEYVVEEDGQILESVREFKARVFALYFAYEFTKDTKYIDFLIKETMAAAAWPDWVAKKSMLDTGEMAMAVAISYDWTYHFLTAEQKKYLEDRLYEMAMKWVHRAQYNVCDYSNFFAITNSNWNAVCNGGFGIAAIALMDVNPSVYADILEKTLVSYEAMLLEFYPDGAWFESVGYLTYLLQFVGYYFTALNTVYGTDFNLSKAPGLDKAGTFYTSMDGMVGYNNYHDSAAPSHLVSPYMYFLSGLYNQPQLTELTMYSYDTYSSAEKGTYMTYGAFDDTVMGRVASLMYYNPYISPATTITYPLDSYFRGPELINLRSSWTDTKGIFLSAHSGENEVNHGHLDAGSFVLDIGGERFAGDIGAESYTAKYYWSDSNKRYFYYRANPQGHNIFVINPDQTHGQDRNGIDSFTAFESKPRGTYAVTSLKSVYKPYAADAQRGYMLTDERRSAVIRDEIRGMRKDENEVYWFLQLQNVTIEILDNKTVLLTKNGVKVRMQIISDAKVQEIFVTDPVVLENTYELNGDDGQNRNWKRLVVKLTTGKDVNITAKFARYCDPIGDTPVSNTPIANWSIPDGELPYLPEIPTFPELNGINLNGTSAVENFDSKTLYYMMVLPYGTTNAPMLEPLCPANATAEVTLPATLPGEAVITLTSTIDSRLKTTYTVFMRAANSIELTNYSGYEDGNPPENCLDGNLATRWAVEGESYGVFTFAEPKAISSVWIATWKAAQRQLLFDIEVSTDGVNFTKVFSGQTQAKDDILEEVKIPAGTYKAVKLVMHGTTTGTWNSVLEVDFK